MHFRNSSLVAVPDTNILALETQVCQFDIWTIYKSTSLNAPHNLRGCRGCLYMYVLTAGIYIIEELPEDGGRDVVDLEDVWSLSRWQLTWGGGRGNWVLGKDAGKVVAVTSEHRPVRIEAFHSCLQYDVSQLVLLIPVQSHNWSNQI